MRRLALEPAYYLPGVAQRYLRVGCKARCAANSPAIGKRRNAADRPWPGARKDHCPKGWSEIGRLDAPAACMGTSHSSRLRFNAIP